MKPLAFIIDNQIFANSYLSLTDHYFFNTPLPKLRFKNKKSTYEWNFNHQPQEFSSLKNDPQLAPSCDKWTNDAKTLLSDLLINYQKVVIIGCNKKLSYWFAAWKEVLINHDQDRVMLLNNHSFSSSVTNLTQTLLNTSEKFLTWSTIQEQLQPITKFNSLFFSQDVSPKKIKGFSDLYQRIKSCFIFKKILINYENGVWRLIDHFYFTKTFLSQLINRLTNQLGIDLNTNKTLKLWINPTDNYQLTLFLAKINKNYPKIKFVYEKLPQIITSRFKHLIFMISH